MTCSFSSGIETLMFMMTSLEEIDSTPESPVPTSLASSIQTLFKEEMTIRNSRSNNNCIINDHVHQGVDWICRYDSLGSYILGRYSNSVHCTRLLL